MALKMTYFRKLFKTFSIFSIALMLTACEVSWFGDIKTDMEGDLTSTLRFYAQTQEVNPDAQVVELTYEITEVVEASEFPIEEIDIVKAGYHIDYWHFYRDSNTNSTQVPSTVYMDSVVKDKVSSIKITPQLFDFYAVWAPDTDTKYTVEHYFQNLTIDGYDVDPGRTQVQTGTTDEQTAAKPYSVTGFEAQTIAQVNIDGDGSAVVKVYYDRCKATVIVDQADGNEPVEYKGYFGQTIEEAVPLDRTADGYTFTQWKITLEDGTEELQEDLKVTYKAQTATYTAQWEEIEYTIAWNLLPQGGKVAASWTAGYAPVESYTVSTGCTIPTAAEITRLGSIFEGWYADPEFTTPAASWLKGQTGNRIFYAKWRNEVYTITYNTNGGTNPAEQPVTYTVDDVVILKSPSLTGWTFKGWYTNAAFTGNAVASWTEGGRTGNLTVYAKWTERSSQISGVTITYPVENDQVLSLSVAYDKNTETWAYSSAPGYSVYNWYYDGTPIAAWSGNSGNSVSLGIELTPGYHSILLVVTDATGNRYSATAEAQVIK